MPRVPQSPESELQAGAEQAYLFRHAVSRDAAYELQLPADRERLHGLAFHAMEDLYGGGAPAMPGQVHTPHATDADRVEVLRHATIVAHQIGDNTLAERLARESLQVALACGSRKLEGAALGSVANICRETGRLHEARQAYEAAVAIHREVGNDSAL